MTLILSIAVVVVGLVVAAWLSRTGASTNLPSWRAKAADVALIFVTLATAGFLVHLASVIAGWPPISRPVFDFAVLSFLIVSALAFLFALFGKGFSRCSSVAGSVMVGYLWLLVAAWSWI
jgi:hypothetical protein